MPIFLMEGEKTEGKLNTTVIKPMMQIVEIIFGRVTALILIASNGFYRI